MGLEPHHPSSSDAANAANAANAVARRLFTREMRGESGDAATLAASERICTHVSEGLSRWFGPFGSRALVARALKRAQTDHAALSGVTPGTAQSACVVGLAESAKSHGAKATAEGVVAMLAALADATGRLIGDDLAINLLEQSTMASSGRGAASDTAAVARSADHSPATARPATYTER